MLATYLLLNAYGWQIDQLWLKFVRVEKKLNNFVIVLKVIGNKNLVSFLYLKELLKLWQNFVTGYISLQAWPFEARHRARASACASNHQDARFATLFVCSKNVKSRTSHHFDTFFFTWNFIYPEQADLTTIQNIDTDHYHDTFIVFPLSWKLHYPT